MQAADLPASRCRLANLRWLGFVNWWLFASQSRDKMEWDAAHCLTKKNSCRAWTEWVGRAMTDSSLRKPKAVFFRAEPLQKMDGRLTRSTIECGNMRQPFAPNGLTMRRPAQYAPDEFFAKGNGQ